jgi:fibronectin-binding autotransporter adhesin
MKNKSNPFRQCMAFTACLALMSGTAAGAAWQWNGGAGTGVWQDEDNWAGGNIAPFHQNVPETRLNVNGAQALEYSAAEGVTNYGATISTSPVSGRALVIGSGTAGSGTMNITGGTFSTLGSLSPDVVGNTANNTGILHISGGSYISGTPGLAVGLNGGNNRTSLLKISGTGSATVTTLFLSTQTSSNNKASVELDGGTLTVNRIEGTASSNASTVYLNGGLLKAGNDANPVFVAAPIKIAVKSGGAKIDSNGKDITIPNGLEEDFDSPGGGLEKTGAGLLTLGALPNITGDVTIHDGGLALNASASPTWFPDSFSHSGDVLNIDLGVIDPFAFAPIDTLDLIVGGTVTLNITGSNFIVGQVPLIQYQTKSITGSLTLNPASLPENVVATLQDDGNGLIYLDVTQAPAIFEWAGAPDSPGTGDWDTTSLNWNFHFDAYSTTSQQIANFPDIPVAQSGDSHVVNLTAGFSPLFVNVSNKNGNPYSFTGSGKITGNTVFTKTDTGRVTFTNGNNDYTGETSISGGALIKQAADSTTGDIKVAADNVTFVLDGGITAGAGQTLHLNGRGATGSGYFFTGSQVQRGALQAHNGANTWAGNIVLSPNLTTNPTRIGVQPGASITLTGSISESIPGTPLLFRAGLPGENITLGGTGEYNYSGSTQLFSAGGSIVLLGNNKLPTVSPVNFYTGGTTVLDLNGFHHEFAGLEGAATGTQGTITNGGSTPSVLTLTLPASISRTAQFRIADGDTQPISLVKKGEGTQVLTFANTYTGNTTVEDGTLRFTQPNFAETSTLTIGLVAESAAVLDLPNAGTTVVAALVIDGVNQPGDGAVYDSVNSDGAITGMGKIQVGTPPAGGYAAWAAANVEGQGPEEDFDSDGVPNGVEFFLNAPAGFTALPALDATNTITWSNGGNIPASAYGSQFVVQTSGNLVDWDDVPVGELNQNTDGPAGVLSYTLSGPGPKFVRLKVTPN